MANDTDGGFSDRQVLNEARGEQNASAQPSRGWASLGAALGGGIKQNAATAYEQGEHLGAQTIDALAQAKQRVSDNNSREQAASFLETNGDKLGLSPEFAQWAATATRGGAKIEDVTNAALQQQQLRSRQHIAGNAPGMTPPEAGSPEDIHRSAMSLDPGLTAVKPIGEAGSTFDPLANHFAGDSAITPQQYDMNQATIGQRTAAAANSNAGANEKLNKPAAGPNDAQDKRMLANNMRPSIDPTTGQPAQDEFGRHIYEQIPNAPQKGEGAINTRRHETMVSANAQLAAEAHNISQLGYDANSGATGFGGKGGGILNTLSDQLGKGMSSTDQQQYQSTVSNIERFVGQIEANGGTVPQSMVNLLGSLKNTPATTYNARLYNTALIRQSAEAGGKTINASQADQGLKDQYNESLEDIRKSIPFTTDDVIAFGKNGKPGVSFSDYLKGGKGGDNAPASGGKDDAVLSAVNAEIARRAAQKNPPRAGDAGPPGVQ